MAAEVRQEPRPGDEYSDKAGLRVKLRRQPVSQGQDQVRTVTGVRDSALIARQVYSGKACQRSTWEIKSARVVSGCRSVGCMARYGHGCDAAAA